eukprot:3936430-Rhodomonas_salina.1
MSSPWPIPAGAVQMISGTGDGAIQLEQSVVASFVPAVGVVRIRQSVANTSEKSDGKHGTSLRGDLPVQWV